MKRILFVDDEPNVLEGLRGVLRKQRRAWEMTFVGSGEEALRALGAGPFDVIVSDMRMPGMDGAALLGRVQREHPAVVRIVLSGQTERQVSRRMVHIAHQFMCKPCDGRDLQAAIERACGQAGLLDDPTLRQAAGQVGHLPMEEGARAELQSLLETPGTSPAELAAVVERDVGLAAKVLQVVGSGLFGAPPVADLHAAVATLGVETIALLAATGEGALDVPDGLDLSALGEHGRRAGRLARRLLGGGEGAAAAYAACLLQDVGLLVLAGQRPELYGQIVETANRSRRPMWEVEAQVLGVTHAEIGAYLLGIWGLPAALVDAVAHHHHPARDPQRGLDLAAAVHIAAALISQEAEAEGEAGAAGRGAPALDGGYLDGLGVGAELERWRALAHAEVTASRN
jgi:HD-like signal output (HDOD) protein/CheY-like chemotaxis protein